VGTEHDIEWSAADPSGVDSVSVLLSVDGGSTFGDTICHGEPNVSPYSWIVSPLYSDSAMIKVLAYDGHKNMGMDVSDSLFATADLYPPEDVDDLSVDIVSTAKSSSGDLLLWWSPVEDDRGVEHYIVYRGLDPYILGDSLAAPAETTYLDVGALGDTLANFFYMVKAVDVGANKSGDSNCVGEFDIPLTNIAPPDTTR